MAQRDRRFEHNDGSRMPTHSVARCDDRVPVLLGNNAAQSKGHHRNSRMSKGTFVEGPPARRISDDHSATTNHSRGRQVVSREQERKEAERQLKEFQDKANNIKVTNMPERASARKKWEHARASAEQVPDLEAWGGGSRGINGAYTYVADQNKDGLPFFQQYADPNKWIYVAISGEWWLGDYSDAKDRQTAKEGTETGLIKTSDVVQPGTLPQAVEAWDVCISKGGAPGEWEAAPDLRFWMADQVSVTWQKLRVDACKCPVVTVTGKKDEIWTGLYDFVQLEGNPGTAPVFQHQQCRKLWLYLGTDQRWWVGFTADMDMRADRGLIYSSHVQPGQHPCEVASWYQCTTTKEERVSAEVKRTPQAQRALDAWAIARKDVETVQIWGKKSKYGEYEFDPCRGGSADPPMYRSKRHADIWLYLANDGAWWQGHVTDADEWKPKGWMRSDPVEPGTLPTAVERWTEQADDTWKINDNIMVLGPQDVANAWKDCRADVEDQPVLTLEGVHGQNLNGLFDYIAEDEDGDADDEPPRFQHQINQDLWLYVATDGCWWVGNSRNMEKRAPKGKMCSEPLQPGTHPRDAVGWQVYDIDAQTFKSLESVSFS